MCAYRYATNTKDTRRRQKSEYEGRQKWTSLFFLGDKQQWIVLTRPDRTRLHQIKPDESTVNETGLTGLNRFDRNNKQTDQSMLTL